MGSYVPPSVLASDYANSHRPSADHYENPFYLHNNDHAGLVLVSDRLATASDFHSWRRSVRMALNVRNKLGFIDSTIPKPSVDDRDYGAWSRCNDMVATWLMNSVSKKIGQSLLFISTAEGIWHNLHTRFRQDDAPRVYDIEQRLSKIEQGSMDVSTYYTDLVTLWEEHRNYVELPVCTCGKCECDAAACWERLQQRSRVTKFLMGLNEAYEQTRRHILMLKPIPTIEEAFNIVTQDERQKSLKPATRVDTIAFQAVSNMDNDGRMLDENALIAAYNTMRNQKPLCTHCGKLGHTVQKCFKLHGFPPGYKTNTYKSQPQSQPQLQARMQMPQHQPRMQMVPYNASIQKANAVANVFSDSEISQSGYSSAVPHVISGGDSVNLQDFTPQQIQRLISQFNSQLKASDTVVPHNTSKPQIASITEHGLMAQTSTSGTYSGLHDWEG